MRGERRTGRWVGTGNSFGTPEAPGIQTSSHSRAILVRLGVLTEELRGTMMCLGRADQLASNVGRRDCKTNQDIVLATECWGLHQAVVVPMESMECSFGAAGELFLVAGRLQYVGVRGSAKLMDGPGCHSATVACRDVVVARCLAFHASLPPSTTSRRRPSHLSSPSAKAKPSNACPALPEFRDAGWIR